MPSLRNPEIVPPVGAQRKDSDMSSNRETIFQGGPAWTMRNSMLNFRTPGLESDAREVGCPLSLPDQHMPVRATEATLGHLPPWAQPAWIRRLPL
jgi:hypothetical protein